MNYSREVASHTWRACIRSCVFLQPGYLQAGSGVESKLLMEENGRDRQTHSDGLVS